MKMITENSIFSDFAIILEITDAQLNFIEEEPSRFFNTDVILEFMKSKGTNAHIIQLTLMKDINIKYYLDILLNKYSSVSWINPDKKFFIKRNLIPLFN